jgi:UDP-N-acetylglucosamine--N-acetylmuramyl-(pentapeptide) pyrophosphoryl-undecaprenol N-acetylglucosamine transferase
MKIVFAGGGTGGHFYPVIAVAQRVNEIIDHENILKAKLYYISVTPYDKKILSENGILYEEVITGKVRPFSSPANILKNLVDILKIFLGTIHSIFKLFSIYPDVVFGKGGYASFPTIFAAFLLNIPVLIHESDSVPGRVNKFASNFAKRIAISFEDSAKYFSPKNIAWTGQPIRREIEHIAEHNQALEYFRLDKNLPVILILGGSQGAELINNVILGALPKLLENYQVIHQTGIRNFKSVSERVDVVLYKNENKDRYTAIEFLNTLQIRMAAGAASIIISRAGSGLFEIAAWGVPSILIPITSSISDHQRKNAFSYARAGACSVIEEMNITANILSAEVERILMNKKVWERMANNAKAFYKPEAAQKIARELVDIALSHEK